jgi:hypothetical protein
VGLVRVELTTSRLSGVRSNHLSYRPTASAALRLSAESFDAARPTMRKGKDRRERDVRHSALRDSRRAPPSVVALARATCRLSLAPVLTSGFRQPSKPRKEVIQPHLPVRLPCYDFTPLTRHTFGSAPLAVRQLTSGIPNSGGVTGGVYKARERIHRAMLMRDY